MALAVACFASSARAAPRTAFVERIFGVDDGLSESGVTTIRQDRDGYLWVGTQLGLNRFDGVRFTAFYVENGLPGNQIEALLVDSSGRVWVGTNAGLAVRAGDRWVQLPLPGDAAARKVTTLVESNGFLFAGVDAHVLRVDLRGIGSWLAAGGPAPTSTPEWMQSAPIPGSPAPGVRQIVSRVDGDLLVATKGGLFALSPTTLAVAPALPEIAQLRALSIASIAWTPRGALWVVGEDGALLRSIGSRLVPFGKAEGLDSSNVSGVTLDGSGALWVRTLEDGTFRIEDDRVERVREEKVRVQDAFVDREGTVWLGGYEGLVRMRRAKFGRLTARDGLPSPIVFPIVHAKNGDAWLGTEHGLVRVRGGALTVFGKRDGFASEIVTSIAERADGAVFVATLAGVYSPKGAAWAPFASKATGLPSDSVTAILFASDGKLWIATVGGLVVLDGTAIVARYTAESGLLSARPYALFEDRSKRMWIGYDEGGGVSYVEGGKLTHLGTQGALPAATTGDFLEDSKGRFWIATTGGLARRDGDAFRIFTVRDGLPSSAVYAMAEDGAGVLWLSTSRGLSTFDGERVLATYTADDGLVSNEGNTDGAAIDATGRLWFSSVAGVTIVDPEHIPRNDVAPTAFVESVRAGDRVLGAADLARALPSIDRNLAFDFTATSFVEPKRMAFAYMLEGFDDAWHDLPSPVPARRATYTNLPPGRYTFRVRATNNDGVWSAPASLSFSLAPPWWRTPWAFVLWLVTAAGLVAAIVQARTSILRRRQVTLEAEADALAKSNAELARLDSLKDEFLANTSHELRTPLNGIIGLAEALLVSLGDDARSRARKNLSMIVASGRRLASLVDDILDFAKLRHGDLTLRLHPIDLRSVVDVVLELSKPLASGKQLALVNDVDAALPPVMADEPRVQQILHNLVGNAIKFTRRGHVRLYATVAGPLASVSVEDTGIGVAPEAQERIFASFEQADGGVAREYGGTGLGLAITRKLVEAHGGTIRVTSTAGEGSTFTFTLPIAAGRTPATAPRPALSATHDAPPIDGASVRAPPANVGTVLVVDDEAVNREVLAQQLEPLGVRVVQVASGADALESLGREAPDLVLLDVMMPQMSGYEVLTHIRQRFGEGDLPVILLTAKARTEDVVAGFAHGANDYLTKPFSREELAARVMLHMRVVQAKRRLAAELDERRRVEATLATKHGEVAILNQELERQIAARSQELAEALAKLHARTTEPPAFVEGDVVERRFRVTRRIGSGAAGNVYEVERISDGRRLAMKVMAGIAEPVALARFAREAQIASSVRHPNVVSLVDVDVASDGYIYLVMELVAGSTLRQLSTRYGDAAWGLAVLRQIAEGLAAIHARGIVHRDLKPANVLVTTGDDGAAAVVKIADFGVSIAAGAVDATPTRNEPVRRRFDSSAPTVDAVPPRMRDASLTETGVLLGTPLYMAPEAVRGARAAHAPADVFSFGVIAHELLLGRRPFADTPPSVALAGSSPPPPSLTTAPLVSQELGELLDACLHVDPAARPTSAELAHALGDPAASVAPR